MKHLLIDLINTQNLSQTTIDNCIMLMTADTPDAGASFESRLTQARLDALTLAQHITQALRADRNKHVNHAELLGMIELEIQEIDRRLSQQLHQEEWPGLRVMKDRLKTMLFSHEVARTARDLR